MSQAESGGVSQQSSRLKNNKAPQLAGWELAGCCRGGSSALLLLCGMLSVTYRDPSTLPSCLYFAFASCLFVATNTGLSVLFSPLYIKSEPILPEGCSMRRPLWLLPEEKGLPSQSFDCAQFAHTEEMAQRLVSSLRKSPDTCW